MKKIIAYSSVVHMNFALLGLFSLSLQGILGSIILMISHGFVSAGLFLSVGVLYDRYHTRILKYFGGFNYFMPIFSIIFLLLTLGNISFPGTVSFIGELLIIIGFFTKNILLTFLTVIGLIFSAIYALWLYNKIFSGQFIVFKLLFNPIKLGLNYSNIEFKRLWTNYFIDVNYREFLIFIPLIVFIIFLGLNPYFVIDTYVFFLQLNFELNYDFII